MATKELTELSKRKIKESNERIEALKSFLESHMKDLGVTITFSPTTYGEKDWYTYTNYNWAGIVVKREGHDSIPVNYIGKDYEREDYWRFVVGKSYDYPNKKHLCKDSAKVMAFITAYWNKKEKDKASSLAYENDVIQARTELGELETVKNGLITVDKYGMPNVSINTKEGSLVHGRAFYDKGKLLLREVGVKRGITIEQFIAISNVLKQ